MIRVVLKDGLVRPDRKPKPEHKQRRPYVTSAMAKVFAQDKPLPEPVWQSVKKAVEIEGKFVPPGKEKSE